LTSPAAGAETSWLHRAQIIEGRLLHPETPTKHEGASDLVANPSYYLVAGARNHLQADRPLEFRFEIVI